MKQAREGRLFILDKMREAIAEPRAQVSPHAPKMLRMVIPVDKIGALIGPGGKTIRAIQEDTGVNIDTEDDGTVLISGLDSESMEKARARVDGLTREIRIGDIIHGKSDAGHQFRGVCPIGARQGRPDPPGRPWKRSWRGRPGNGSGADRDGTGNRPHGSDQLIPSGPVRRPRGAGGACRQTLQASLCPTAPGRSASRRQGWGSRGQPTTAASTGWCSTPIRPRKEALTRASQLPRLRQIILPGLAVPSGPTLV